MIRERNCSGPAAEAVIPSAGARAREQESELTSLFARLRMLQQQTAEACNTEQWSLLGELDTQLQRALAELAPHRHRLDAQQQALLRRFADQYQRQLSRVREQAGELEQHLGTLRRQHQGTLAYDWISQLEESSS